jgi:hypothetical protein
MSRTYTPWLPSRFQEQIHAPTPEQILCHIEKGYGVSFIGQMIYERLEINGCWGVFDQLSLEAICARELGVRIMHVDDIERFYTAVTPAWIPNLSHDTVSCMLCWARVTTEVVRGFKDGGGIKTARDATRCLDMLLGYSHTDGYLEGLERDIIRRATFLLIDADERAVFEFGCSLKSRAAVTYFVLNFRQMSEDTAKLIVDYWDERFPPS